MSDVYKNYQALTSDKVEGIHYQVRYQNHQSLLCLSAPHGGGIEAGTTELVEAISMSRPSWSWYVFEGLQSSGNRDLHITSTNFDEPRQLRLLENVHWHITFHGMRGTKAETYIGGRDVELKEAIRRKLTEKGFIVKDARKGFAGMEVRNITNATVQGMGVQLELTAEQRKQFFQHNNWAKSNRRHPSNWTKSLHHYKNALIEAIEEHMKRRPS
ncbi:poly-gamma-glutamate hydrolase family protein [Priestia endophytica]|uniref:poly-gamma-glutamate hydrolase family protein n=1 Tax=Priestia endophytica TaxID=135735 RepID=UPI000DCA5DF2|nr:poly-gamma-glutamate hydrolase family protein [Priestia endophytica]RAS81098.1 hypothetical protein A4U60_14070 [Priestia endophytica]